MVIDEPRGQVYGGVVAAPAFNQIAVKTAYYLGIQPTEPIAASEPGKSGKPEAPEAPGTTHGIRVTPVSSAASPSPMIMPDLAGLSMGRVVDQMNRYPVKLSMAGSGVARSQTPVPGTVLSPGAECVVTFAAECTPAMLAAKKEKR